MNIKKEGDKRVVYFNDLATGETFFERADDNDIDLLIKIHPIVDFEGNKFNAVFLHDGGLVCIEGYTSVYKLNTEITIKN